MRKDAFRCLVGLLAAFGLLLLPAGALADVTVTGFTVVPSTTAAGAHPDVTITENFSYSDNTDSVKETVLHFPPGLLGNPQATPLCSDADFNADTCPANTQVGTVVVGAQTSPLGATLPPSNGKIFNLVPDAAHPAVLGIFISAPPASPIHLKSPISLRTSTDFGIDSPTDNQPQSVTIGPLNQPIQVTSTTLTLFGNPPGGNGPFMSNPTSCKPATTNFDAISYGNLAATATKSDTFTPTACDQIPFAPKISATMGAQGETTSGTHPPFQATITQAVGEASQLSAAVTLPPSLSSAVGTVSTLCTADQLAVAACPDASRIGTATIASPLLPTPVQGPVFALLRPAQLPGVGVEFGGTLPFVLGGSAGLAPGGRLQNSFTGLPDVPLTSFALQIDGGAHGLLSANRNLCTGPAPTVDGAFTGQNGASVTASAPVTVQGCGTPRLAKPHGKASLTHLGSRHPLLKLTVLKGSAKLRSISVTLPKSLHVTGKKRGLSATGAAFKLSKKNIKLSRKGKLTLKLPARGASRVTAKLGGGSFLASKRLRKKRSASLRIVVRTVDVAGHGTVLHLKVKGRH